MTPGKRIKKLLIDHDRKLSDLQKYLGLSYGCCSTYVRDARRPDAATQAKIAAFFGVKTAEIFGE